MEVNTWTRQLSKICVWDPREEGLEPNVDINTTKIRHLTKKFLAEDPVASKYAKDKGVTTYEIAKTHITANNMLLICGVVTMEKYLKVTEKGVNDSKQYDTVIDDPEKFFEACRETCVALSELLAKPEQAELGDLGVLKMPNEASTTAINALLTSSALPKLEDLFNELAKVGDTISAKEAERQKAMEEYQLSVDENERLKSEVTKLMATSSTLADLEYSTDRAEIPDGKVVMRKASEMFPIELTKDFEVPTWEWDGDHPDVPAKDENYIFREKHLVRALYAIVTNQREYIQGHTGSGKTTLVEQVAAHLNWPFVRINFDSEITRMDLIGRDTLVASEDGKVTSVFEDGMLPTAMSNPVICCFDELDFVRPDVAYVMQAALEGNGLRITEDGDRLVQPHPMFRMFGTGNTVGQGDEHGMYQGARPQSMAFLDRFTIWDKINYLSKDERESLVKRKFPALGATERKQVLQYTTEHLEAFEQGKVIQPISPRGMLAICQASIMMSSVKDALEMTVLDRANVEDRATLKGLVDRVSR